MLNHTYTSVKNANLVDCGKKTHIVSQPSTLLRDNYLGEYRTELDKKKVLANLGIATDLSLEWEYIKGDIGRSEALMGELDSRTKYISDLDGFQKTIIEGVKYLETIVGGEQEAEAKQDKRLTDLETSTKELSDSLDELKAYLQQTIEVDIDKLEQDLQYITEKVDNITELIKVSDKDGNALILLTADEVEEGKIPGLYVPDLSQKVQEATDNIGELQEGVKTINDSLESFVTREELGGGDFNFIKQEVFEANSQQVSAKFSTIDTSIEDINKELDKTVKKDEDGHVNALYVNSINKNNNDDNIQISDSFEVTSGIPLDVRFVRENLEELYELPVAVCYPGMGVVVNSLSSLYILRKPSEGISLNQDYIRNPNNWKCPEDLVTVALTVSEYEALEEVNPNVFYYIYENEITRTQEPKRSEYLSDQEYEQAFQQWVDSLKTLSQEYMSAAWGVDIENKLGKKASSQSVSILLSEINNIKGNGNNPSLESLNKSIQNLETKDEIFSDRVDEILIKYENIEQGRLVDVEKEIDLVKSGLSEYVTKEYIQNSSNDFIFLKKEEYQVDKESLESNLSNQVTTNNVITNSITLGSSVIESFKNRLQINSQPLAELSDLPLIEIISQEAYDNMEEKDPNTYYYTYDGDDIYVTKPDLIRESSKLQKQINVLFKGGTAEDVETSLETVFLPIEVWNTFQENYQNLQALVSELEQRLIKLEPISGTYESGAVNFDGDSSRLYQEGDTLFINDSDITT